MNKYKVSNMKECVHTANIHGMLYVIEGLLITRNYSITSSAFYLFIAHLRYANHNKISRTRHALKKMKKDNIAHKGLKL